jgi:carboxyl-terminal processing protease
VIEALAPASASRGNDPGFSVLLNSDGGIMGKILSWKDKSWGLFIFGLGMGVGLAMGCQFLNAYTPSAQIPASAVGDFGLMAEAWNTIEKFYVDRAALKPRRMTYGAISGMTASLEDTEHSRFLTPEMVKQEKNSSQGTLEGIGVEVRMKNNQMVILTPLDGSPGQKAGLKPGDIILKVNDQDISSLPLGQAVGLILGPPGTPVKLTIFTPQTDRTREIILTRARIVLQNVTWAFLAGSSVAHVRIASFSAGVTRDLRKVLSEVKQKREAHLILDLRNNPGGLFKEAVGTASQFLGSGIVVWEKDAKGKVTSVAVKPGGLAVDLPMVVLANGGTASAAEIVAGALQDRGRSRIVGEKTFGTGTVLEKFSLSDGSALLLAIEEWLTPDERTIWHQGIRPNVRVPLSPDANPLFPLEDKNMTMEQIQASKDTQLLRALEIISPSGSSSAKPWAASMASPGALLPL